MRRPKHSSDEEDRSEKKKKKKIKSKSRKHHSSSSDSGEEFRARKKMSKSKKLFIKKKKDYKKSEKKKRKKRARKDSSSECSTYSDSDRSRNPVRKSKKRKREKERGRKRLRIDGNKHRRCRSSSSSESSWSRSMGQSYENYESSRRQSLIEERLESSYKETPTGERFEKSQVEEKFENGNKQSYIDDRFEDSRLIEDRFEGRYRNSLIEDRYESSYRESLIEERFWRKYGKNIIGEEREIEMGARRRLRSIVVVNSVDEDADKVIETNDENLTFSDDEIHEEGNKFCAFEVGDRENESDLIKKDDIMVKESAVVEDGGKKADDLELILRQKALENFKKFRGRRPVKVESLDDKKDESSKVDNSIQSSHILEKTLESKYTSSVDDQCYEPKAKLDANIPVKKKYVNTMHKVSNDIERLRHVGSSITAENTSNSLNKVESSNKVSSENTALVNNDNQNKRIFTQSVNRTINGVGANVADSSVSVVHDTENQTSKLHEAVVESSSGSQFQQKTFSRMRDGEMVEVKYKVYIPKKTPALARRQLQR